MSCEVGGRSEGTLCSSAADGTACIISLSKMNISKTTTRRDGGHNMAFADSMDHVPTCGLLKSSVAICACLFGNMFVGKRKNPFDAGSDRMKALQYFEHCSSPCAIQPVESPKADGAPVMIAARNSSLQDRQILIERAEKKMQELTSLYRDSWDMYRLLISENLDTSPFRENVLKIQVLLSRVTKFLTFAHGKLVTLKTMTLLELIEMLEELEYVLKLTSDMRRATDSTSSVKEEVKGNPEKQEALQMVKDDALVWKTEEKYKIYKNLGKGDADDSLEKTTKDITVMTALKKQNESQKSELIGYKDVPMSKTVESQKHKESNTFCLSMEKLGCGDMLKDPGLTRNTQGSMASGLRKKQRSVYAGMKHPISRFDVTNRITTIEDRVKSTISHINALGRVEAPIDKTRLEKIFGKIGRMMGESNVRKPAKTKMEQITREFVKVKDTIIRLMKLRKSKPPGNEVIEKEDSGGKEAIAKPSDERLKSLESCQTTGTNKYENKLEQLNKRLEEVKTAYDLLRTVSLNAMTQQSRKSEVQRLMTHLSVITSELNKMQPSFTRTTVMTVTTVNEPSSNDSGSSADTPQSSSDVTKVSIAVDTSETAGMKWPNPRYQSVLYNFDSDEQSQNQIKQNTESKEEAETQAPGEKGTQTRLDTISSWIEKHRAGEVVYEESCIVTIGQPLRRTRSVNIVNQESRKLAAKRLKSHSSETMVSPAKSKQMDNCRNRFLELLKVGRDFIERSCKKSSDKCDEKTEDSKKNRIEESGNSSKGKVKMKDNQTSCDVVGSAKSACLEQNSKVKEAVENALAGIESAYSVALREFIGMLNTQGIGFKMNSYSKSTSTTTLKGVDKQVQYVSHIVVDSISLGAEDRRTNKRVPMPSSKSRILPSHRRDDSSQHLVQDTLVDYITAFDHSSLLLIQNNNFK